MKKKTGIIIGVIAAAFVIAGLIAISIWQSNHVSEPSGPAYQLSEVSGLTNAINFDSYDFTKIIPADMNTGYLSENIKGDPDAPVKIFEYADYQCEHCAALNPLLNQIYEDYDGKVAIVFRAYIMSYHKNGVITAAAANAANIQGYWPEYKDLLFGNQNEWFSMNTSDMPELLEGYFVTASGGKGDLEKFRSDMQSRAVTQKIAFDLGAGDQVDLQWTPSIYVNGEFISQKKDENTSYSQSQFDKLIRNKIDSLLKSTK